VLQRVLYTSAVTLYLALRQLEAAGKRYSLNYGAIHEAEDHLERAA
jgi:hypothetical protein